MTILRRETVFLEVASHRWSAAVVETRSRKPIDDLPNSKFTVVETCGHRHFVNSKRLLTCGCRLNGK